MKKLFFLIALFFLGIIGNKETATAASIFISSTSTVLQTPKKADKNVHTNVKKQSFWQRLAHPFERTDDKDLIFYLLCIFIGTLGIHRVIMGSKPMIMLWYILAAIVGVLIAGLLASLSFGILSFLGWVIVAALPLSDLIAAFLKGTSYFQGNDDIFAGFKGLGGGKK